ncbi:peptide/nickel transport system permease protein [Friedmanniella endophytica]|uniref:Peptide/nickel transport system permease protein n=1 Tax=Microlunatus kandeliicorticis TaxID=1759536 RepID=A0A7W3IV56_9ACTN|nr:ABC transporter permease [Microlunatus kandeliicorticis]MBA8795700.1 peptide/nickel transport system permease protein [Microlunatus kandeliicorticis]
MSITAGVEPPGTPPTLTAAPEGGPVHVSIPIWRLALRSFVENRLAVAGVVILVFFVLFSFVGPLLYHTNQVDTDIANTFLPPQPGNPLGTESHGFDVLGRLMKGGQSSLEIAFLSAVIATVIGTLYGALAGLAGGLLDAAMMRLVDVLLAIPFLFIVLIIATRFNASVLSLSLLLGAFSWLVPARLVRGEVLSLRSRDFVSAARVMGAGRWRLISRHLIPNALGVVVVNITFQVADALLAVSALGFLGFGLNYPQVSWGDMLSNGISYLLSGYWWLIYPVGLCLVLVVMASNFIGDALRDAVDVRLRRR